MSDLGRGNGHSDDIAKYLSTRLYISISAESIIFQALLHTYPKVVRLSRSRAAPAQSCILTYHDPPSSKGGSITSHCDHGQAFFDIYHITTPSTCSFSRHQTASTLVRLIICVEMTSTADVGLKRL